MREYIKQEQLTPDEHDKLQLQEWLANSHYWIEKHQTYICKWCGISTTTTCLEGDAHLCKENPIIKKIDKADIKIIENKYPIKCSECGKTIDNEFDDAGCFGICYDCY